MNKFSLIVEQNESQKYFKINSEVDLVILADSEGEAGYLADSQLGAIESHSDFRILNISEMTREEYEEIKVTESVSTENDMTASQKILSYWNSEFGGRKPTAIERFEFYRKMRDEKFDADLIIDTLQDNICSDWNNK